MSKKRHAKTTAKPAKREFPIVIETFRDVCGWTIDQLRDDKPSCFNGNVRVRRYRITVEEIKEPIEEIRARLVKLWRESDNHHHIGPLRKAAAEVGFELDMDDFKADCPPNKRGWG